MKPTNYSITLTELESQAPWKYQGNVSIELQINKPTSSITLNTFELELHSASLTAESGKTGSSIDSSNISYDVKNQRCTISFDHEIPHSGKAVLEIKFAGTMNGNMAGFYRR